VARPIEGLVWRDVVVIASHDPDVLDACDVILDV
jgi:hypothetical protein